MVLDMVSGSSAHGFEYPPALKAAIAHATRFSEALDALFARASKAEPAFVWLIGRSSEVRVFVCDVVGEWSHGRQAGVHASDRIERYLCDLHDALEARRGTREPMGCCRRGSGERPAARAGAQRRRLLALAPPIARAR
jgi:hypothetical protein